jgi:predicted nucleotidyltransferase
MMQACGVIVEYNPFHNGHKYHLEKARSLSKASCMIAVMSGNFLQRGEPAIIDKYHRAKLATEQGCDIVIELPYYYAVQHSELFAMGAIKILKELGVHSLCFGSESGEIDAFHQTIDAIEKNQFIYQESLKNAIKKGNSYPKSHQIALNRIFTSDTSIDIGQPNNMLGLQYIKQIHNLNANIKPLTIKRAQSNYHDETISLPFASATSIRRSLLHTDNHFLQEIQDSMPKMTSKTLEMYKKQYGCFHTWEAYFKLLQYNVLTSNESVLRTIHGVNEGIEHRIIRTAKDATSFQTWMQLLKTKRYTWTSLQRIFTHILTKTTKEEVQQKLLETPPIRILSMTGVGRQYLNDHKKGTNQLFISNKNPFPDKELDERISSAYYSIIDSNMMIHAKKQAYLPPYMA